MMYTETVLLQTSPSPSPSPIPSPSPSPSPNPNPAVQVLLQHAAAVRPVGSAR